MYERIRYFNNKNELHRLDGPAIEYANGRKYYFIAGKQLTEEEFNNREVNLASIQSNC
jgi:Mor family transcriptional regulator